VVPRDGGDGGGALERVPQHPAAPEGEEPGVEVVSPKERDERDAEPGSDGRAGEDGRRPPEGDDVTRPVGKAGDLVPEEVDGVGRILVEGRGEEEASLLPLETGAVLPPPEVRDVDGKARGAKGADDPVARLRHPAPVGRVVLGEDERAQRQLSPNPAAGSSASDPPESVSSKERVS
jgi:hypothetical protein